MGRRPSIVEDYREWQCRLERYQTSEASLDVFCLQEGVSRSTSPLEAATRQGHSRNAAGGCRRVEADTSENIRGDANLWEWSRGRAKACSLAAPFRFGPSRLLAELDALLHWPDDQGIPGHLAFHLPLPVPWQISWTGFYVGLGNFLEGIFFLIFGNLLEGILAI